MCFDRRQKTAGWVCGILELVAALLLVIKRLLWCASEECSTTSVLSALEQQMQVGGVCLKLDHVCYDG